MTTANLPEKVSDIFDPQRWRVVEGFEDFTDIKLVESQVVGDCWIKHLLLPHAK